MLRGEVIFLTVAVVLISYVQADLFTALATLTKALYTEKELAGEIRNYIKAEQERLEKLKRVADIYESHADQALEDAEAYLANPVNAYLFVKRFTSELPALKDLMSSQESYDVFEEFQKSKEGFMPTQIDMDGVTDAILRLQDTYQIPAAKVADGSFTPNRSSPRMNAGDCFEIGRHAFDVEDKYHALMWLMESLATVELSSGKDKSVDMALLYDFLTYAADDQGNIFHAYHYCREFLKLEPEHERMQRNLAHFVEQVGDRMPKVLPPVKNIRVPRRDTLEYKNYEALCRGEDIMQVDMSEVRCYYENQNKHPLLILAPVKVEQMSIDPHIVIFHDVVSDYEIEVIKNISTPNLKQAVVFDPISGKLVTAKYRVSRSAWLLDDTHEVVERISGRISAVTGLNLETAEPLQVVNYGIGGQYEPHFDHARKNDAHQFEISIGNRVATWIFYFSDVDAGGLTVFTEIGVKVHPKKRTAAFWFNLRKNGEPHDLTRHAGCPVLAGSKWVANKWIHMRGQEFYRPCGLKNE